ncbi:MAG: iron chelate uptake ABC transporter family permease subunit [Deltaproteobacteria bacterium]|nr:iron chelate uptake ABC transporter family permease subunit [Deltaproteobacteria bacterium]
MTPRTALRWAWFGGLAATACGGVVGLALGPAPHSLIHLVRGALAGDLTAQVILLDVRAPRTLGAWLVGAALALAGALLQTATHNPIADPYLVGTSAGATLAAVSVVPVVAALGAQLDWQVGGWLPWLQPLAAFGGALLAVSMAFRLARRASAERILVAGLVMTAFAGAATSFVLTQLSDTRLRAATHWLMGGVALPDLGAALPGLAVVAGALLWSLAHLAQLQALTLGDERAAGLGVDATRLGRRAVWWASALSAVAVSIAGIVGFVGLLVPNALKLWLGRDQRATLPASALFGGGLLAALDGLSRQLAAPGEVPLGVLTALCGAPLLVVLLRDAVAAIPLPRLHGSGRALGDGVQLSVRGLCVRFGDRGALHGVDLEAAAPALVAIVGENGSGKSTLLRALAGVQPADAGSVLLGGAPPLGALGRGDIGWLPQAGAVESGVSADDLVALGRHARIGGHWLWRVGARLPAADQAIVARALAQVDLADRAHLDVGALSGGERQRALVAMVLALEPRVLLLDEPTASLDPGQTARLFATLRALAHSERRLVVVATHAHAAAAAHADWVVALADGEVVGQGPHGDAKVQAALLGGGQ